MGREALVACPRSDKSESRHTKAASTSQSHEPEPSDQHHPALYPANYAVTLRKEKPLSEKSEARTSTASPRPANIKHKVLASVRMTVPQMQNLIWVTGCGLGGPASAVAGATLRRMTGGGRLALTWRRMTSGVGFGCLWAPLLVVISTGSIWRVSTGSTTGYGKGFLSGGWTVCQGLGLGVLLCFSA